MAKVSKRLAVMFDIPQAAADAIFGWANVVLISGAALVLIGTIGAIWSAGIRERFADERISRNEAETETAKAIAAKANEETAKAKLEQEKLKAQLAWRTISPQMSERLLHYLSQRNGSVLLAFTANDPEATTLAVQLSRIFMAAQWKVSSEARSYGDGVVFGILIPGPNNEETKLVRTAFAAAEIAFATNDLPQPAMSYTKGGGASVTIMIGSKPPSF